MTRVLGTLDLALDFGFGCNSIISASAEVEVRAAFIGSALFMILPSATRDQDTYCATYCGSKNSSIIHYDGT